MSEKLELYCGAGWKNLYQPLIDRCNAEGVAIRQIKEKFGGLRFYTDGSESKELSDAIDAAEHQSFGICEQCGEPGTLRSGSWLRTLCNTHAVERGYTMIGVIDNCVYNTDEILIGWLVKRLDADIGLEYWFFRPAGDLLTCGALRDIADELSKRNIEVAKAGTT